MISKKGPSIVKKKNQNVSSSYVNPYHSGKEGYIAHWILNWYVNRIVTSNEATDKSIIKINFIRWTLKSYIAFYNHLLLLFQLKHFIL